MCWARQVLQQGSGERDVLCSQGAGDQPGDPAGAVRLEVGVVVAEELSDRSGGVVAVVGAQAQGVVVVDAEGLQVDDR